MASSRNKMNLGCNNDILDKRDSLSCAEVRLRSMNILIEKIKSALDSHDSKIESYQYVWQI
jgi:hypothetical protein